MNVLLLRGNPRKTGYTQRFTDLFLQGLFETKAEVVDVDLSARSVLPCLGCYHCWLVTPGQCVHPDDMGELLEHVLAADVLVCATPLYFYSMSSLMKVFIERLLPLTKQGFVKTARGLTRNSTRYPERWQGKKLISIFVGALKDPETYRPANETFQLIADGLGLELGGQLTRPESYLTDYPLSKPKTLKLIEAAFIEAGREAGMHGQLTQKTMSAAALPLASDLEHFRTYANIYWARAEELGAAALTPSEVQSRVAEDVRILMREMVRTFDARAAARIKAVLQFEFPDQNLHFRVHFDRGCCELTEGTSERPDLRIRCATPVWAGIFTQQIEVRDALKDRRLLLEGDKSLFARLGRFFPPPSA
jgi:multimeric flavodoxin WrbA/putative sterol carrier protein